jgi:hypothetical protein
MALNCLFCWLCGEIGLNGALGRSGCGRRIQCCIAPDILGGSFGAVLRKRCFPILHHYERRAFLGGHNRDEESLSGVRGGPVIGSSDDFGYKAAEQPLSYHDVHATMLHLLGMDHKRLTYLFNGLR